MKFAVAAVLLAVWACLVPVRHADSKETFPHTSPVVSGTPSPRVPWQAMVHLSDTILDGGYAGGALISDRWVLTTGRNVFVRKSSQENETRTPVIPKVYLGINNKSQADASNEYEVEKVVLHPHFQNHSDWDNDLALILLKKRVALSSKVIPIPLPEEGQDLADVLKGSGVIAGWGIEKYVMLSQSLKHLVVPIVNRAECEAEIKRLIEKPHIDHDVFCTGPTNFDENVCYGDAGGALAVRDAKSGEVYAAGILSFDSACNVREDRQAAVYMKLSSYLPWIHSVMRGDTEQSVAERDDAMSQLFSSQS